jgi:hypothetical protein
MGFLSGYFCIILFLFIFHFKIIPILKGLHQDTMLVFYKGEKLPIYPNKKLVCRLLRNQHDKYDYFVSMHAESGIC